MAETCDDSHAGVPDPATIISVTVEGRISFLLSRLNTLGSHRLGLGFATTHAVGSSERPSWMRFAPHMHWSHLKGRWIGGLNLHSELSEVSLDVDHLCGFCHVALFCIFAGQAHLVCAGVFIVECFLQSFSFGQ